MLSKIIMQDSQSIINLVIAIIPLLLAILALQKDKTEKVKTPLDSSLKIISITRTPLEEQFWGNVVAFWQWSTKWLVLYTLVIILALFLLQVFDWWAFLLYLPFMLLYARFLVNLWASSYRYRSSNAIGGKFFLFQQAELIIEADLQTLFFKAHQALLGRHVKYLDTDFQSGKIEAFQEGDIVTTQGKITVTIEPVKKAISADEQGKSGQGNHKVISLSSPTSHVFSKRDEASDRRTGCYSIIIKFEPSEGMFARFTRSRSPLGALAARLYPVYVQQAKKIEASSRVANHFVEKFLRSKTEQPKSEGLVVKPRVEMPKVGSSLSL